MISHNRSLSFRPALAVLHRRIQTLQAMLLERRIAIPPMSEEDDGVVNRIFDAVGLEKLSPPQVPIDHTASSSAALDVPTLPDLVEPNVSTAFAGASSSNETARLDQGIGNGLMQQSDTALMSNDDNAFNDPAAFSDLSLLSWDDNLSPDWPWMGMFVPEMDFNADPTNGTLDFMAEPAGGGNIHSRRNSQGGGAGGDSDGDDEVNPELIGQIAARVGALHLAPDGKLRYFGTPANTYLFHGSGPSAAHSKPRSLKWEGKRLLRNADLDQAIDDDLEEHFLGLFFSWYNPCHAVVDGPMFSTARKRWREVEENDGFYSDVLLNAM